VVPEGGHVTPSFLAVSGYAGLPGATSLNLTAKHPTSPGAALPQQPRDGRRADPAASSAWQRFRIPGRLGTSHRAPAAADRPRFADGGQG